MGEEAVEVEAVAGNARLHEGGHEGCGTGQALHLDIVGQALAHEEEAGIGDARSARIAHEGHLLMGFDFGKESRHLCVLVEDVVRHTAFFYLIVFQQFGGGSGIFAENQIHGAQHIERPEGDVLQVADGSRDKVEFHCNRI